MGNIVPQQKVNYDQLSSTYNRRFELDTNRGVGDALVATARRLKASRILEAGCGTGHWLARLTPAVDHVYGLDLSAGMLAEAQKRQLPIKLVRGCASRLPFTPESFDFVYCVNALHHFSRPQTFITEAYRVLRPDGLLAIVGSDPHGRRDNWYVYDYFEGVYERDLERFPRRDSILAWMRDAGFEQVDCHPVERITESREGRDVLEDPFLEKHACSQLALLSDEDYAAGIARIEAAIDAAEVAGETISFRSDIVLTMLSGQK